MKGRAKLLVPLFAVLVTIGATALPSFAAPEKIFRVDITPTSVSPGPETFQVVYRNITPGNATFNSFRLTVPTAFTVSGTVTLSGSNANANAVVTVDGQIVTVTGLDAVKNNQQVTLSVPTSVSGGNGCSSTTVTWPDSSFQAWTGSNTSGTMFRLAEKSGATTTVSGASCSLRFQTGGAPDDAIANETIKGTDGGAVRVEVLSGSSVNTGSSAEVTIQLVDPPSGVTLQGITTVKAVNGVASFTDLKIPTPGSYSLKATSPSHTDSSNVTIRIYEAGIACGEDDTASGGGTSVTLERPEGTQAGDDECSAPVPYTLEVSADGREVTLRKDDPASQLENARFVLTVAWLPEPATYPNPGRTTTFDLDFDGPLQPVTVGLCETVDGVIQYPDNPGPNGFYPAAGADFPWCVASAEIVPAAGGNQQVTEVFFGAGDPLAKR